MKMIIYSIVYAIVNVAVIFGIMRPWKQELQSREAIATKELSFAELYKADPAKLDLPVYFRLKDAQILENLATSKTKKNIFRGRKRGLNNRLGNTFETTHFGLIPIIEKGGSVEGNPVLVWMYFYKSRGHGGNPANYREDYQIPWNLAEWRDSGSILENKPFRYMEDKATWESLLSETFKKYNIIPVKPERLYFLSPVIQKVDWSFYNFWSKVLLVLDGIAFLPILFSAIFFFLTRN